MAPPPKRKGGGRVTPKGTRPGEPSPLGRPSPPGPAGTPAMSVRPDGREVAASSRYTPPVPKEVKVSPRWVPVLMFSLLGVGAVIIFLNYMGWLPGATDNWYLLVGLVLILAGIVTATNYH